MVEILPGRPIGRVGDDVVGAVLHRDVVDDVRRRGNQVEAEFPFQPVPGDFQVQQTEIAAAVTEAERRGGLRLVGERGVIEPELVQRVPQDRVVGPVQRIQPGVDHRVRVAVAAERDGGALALRGDGVADLGLPDVLHPGDQVADLADAEPDGGDRFRRDDADLEQFVHGPGGHHLDPLARGDLAVDHPDVGDHAAVDVVDRVEDHRPGRRVGVAGRMRDVRDHLVQQFLDPDAGLAGHPQHIVRRAADDVRDLLGVTLRLGGRQVDLVQHRDDVQVVLQRQVQVGQRLRLDALRGVDQQHRTLAGGQRAGDLIGEVDVPGGVDQVQHVVLVRPARPLDPPRQPHGLRLDGDAALAFDVHPVQVLRAHGPAIDHPGELQHPVGQRRFAVVDVRDDAEVPDEFRRGERAVRTRGEASRGHRNLSTETIRAELVLCSSSHGLSVARDEVVARSTAESSQSGDHP